MRKRIGFWILLCFMLCACEKVADVQAVHVEVEEIEQEKARPTVQEIKPTAEPEQKTEEVTLVMVGDILLHTPVSESAHREDGTYDYTPVFAQVKGEVEGADLALVNEEVMLGGSELGVSGYPAFNGPYEVADALVDTGFDVILQATNHALDKGKKGIQNCLTNWKSKYPSEVVLGIHDSQESYDEVYITEIGGMKLAILNYTYGTNGIPLPSDMPYGVSLLEEQKVKSDLAFADANADFTIVCPHWGTEYKLEPSAEQDKWVSIFAAGGADLVIGTHPHVIEPVAMTENKDGKPMLVYYSLGNFVNWTSGEGPGTANRMLGAMAKVTLAKGSEGVYVKSYEALPMICHVSDGFGGVRTYFMKDYAETLSGENKISLQDSSFSLEYEKNLWQQVMGAVPVGE